MSQRVREVPGVGEREWRRRAAAGARGARAQRHARLRLRRPGARRALHRHRQDHVRQGHLLARHHRADAA